MLKMTGFFLLGVLKFIGFLLLFILACLFLILLCIMLMPVRYKVSGNYEPKTEEHPHSYLVQANIFWLFCFLSICFLYENTGTKLNLRVFGLDIQKLRDWKQSRTRKKETGPVEEIEPTEELEQVIEPEVKESEIKESEVKEPELIEEFDEELFEEELNKEFEKESKRRNKQKRDSKWKDRKQKAGWVWSELHDETNHRVVAILWKEVCYLIRHYGPNKLKADITYSLGDPALTGEVLGGISLFPVIYRQPCVIVPDFETEHIYIKGEMLLRGHVRLCHILISFLRMILKPEIRKTYRKFRTQNH